MEDTGENTATAFRQETFAEETLDTQSRKDSHQAGSTASNGALRWITPALIADTTETWQPYYATRLTEEDAVEILVSVGELLDALELAG